MTAVRYLLRDWWLVVIAAAVAVLPAVLHLDRGIFFWWLALGGAGLWLLWLFRSDLLWGVLVWFAVLACLHEEFWRFRAEALPALTIPRIWMVILTVSFVLMLVLGRVTWKPNWTVLGPAALLLAYFTVSAAVSGFKTVSVASVHYRLIGGWLMPIIAMLIVSHSLRSERQLTRWLIFFSLLGAYLTYIGYCEHFRLWSFVWPRFIADPTRGIHWGRVRGPFLVSAVMGVVLVYCFFNNLVLARLSRPAWRWALYVLNAASLPVIFWTYTRAVWLAMLVGTAIWLATSRRGLMRTAGVLASVAASLVLLVGLWPRLSSPQRTVGGWTDKTPIQRRYRCGWVLPG